MENVQKAPGKRRLVLDTLQVETFAPLAEPAARELGPTATPNTWPPCCSEQLVCV